MRFRITMVLLLVYLISTTEAYQLLKLPAFVVHFVQHKRDDPKTSLIGFLKQHYAESQEFDADWQQDMRLPFKMQENNMSLNGFWNFPPHTFILSNPVWPQPINHKQRLSCQYLAGRYSPEVFQPPRV